MGPILVTAAVVATAISVTTTVYSTYRTCSEDGSWAGSGYSQDCAWSMVGAGLSLVPFVGLAFKPMRSLKDLATNRQLPADNSIDSLALNAKAGSARFGQGTIENMGLMSDGIKRGLDNKSGC